MQGGRAGSSRPRKRISSTLPGCAERTGAVTSLIDYHAEPRALRLSFKLAAAPMAQRVPIHWLPTAGCAVGLRAWFGCPLCGRRASKLFLAGSGFGCRQCQDISYQTQSDGAVVRAVLAQARTEAALGPGLTRPAGMHRSTHARLLENWEQRDKARRVALRAEMRRALADFTD